MLNMGYKVVNIDNMGYKVVNIDNKLAKTCQRVNRSRVNAIPLEQDG